MNKAVIVLLLLVFGLGSCMGAQMTTPEVEFVPITKTETVTEPAPPPVTKYVMPESCSAALKYAARMTTASENMYNRGRQQLDIISDVRSKLAVGGNTTDESNRQRDLSGLLVGDLSDLEAAAYRYEVALDKCEEEKP